MSIKRASLLASGLGLIMCTVASSSGATPRHMSGYSAFRPWPNYNTQLCVNEFYGGALNMCAGNPQPHMIFELPIAANGGIYDISAYGFSSGGSGSYTCQAVAISNFALTGNWTGTVVTYTGALGESRTTSIQVPGGWSLRLQCDNVPVWRGIQSISWGLSEF
jgi:hypothetical protein